MSQRLIVFKLANRWHYHVESKNENIIYVSEGYFFKRNAERDAREEARHRKAKFVGYEKQAV